MHQVALDGGSWDSGELYLLKPDPTAPAQYPGDPGEVEDVYRFRRAQRELKGKGKPPKVSSEDEAAPTPKPKKPKPKKGGGRGVAAEVADE